MVVVVESSGSGWEHAGWLGAALFGLLAVVFAVVPTRIMPSRPPSPPFPAGRVLVVTAHPDDESMFFAPALQTLVAAGHPVSFLCLSNGGADGLGAARTEEMFRAAMSITGVDPLPLAAHRDEERTDRGQTGTSTRVRFRGGDAAAMHTVCVVDSPRLADGMDKMWPAEEISDEIAAELDAVGGASSILTFDRGGVSGHPNHVAVRAGVAAHLRRRRDSGGLAGYELDTVPIWRKYLGPVDYAVELSLRAFCGGNRDASLWPTHAHWTGGVAAMREHATQMVWFRWLFVIFSRYGYFSTVRAIIDAD